MGDALMENIQSLDTLVRAMLVVFCSSSLLMTLICIVAIRGTTKEEWDQDQ